MNKKLLILFILLLIFNIFDVYSTMILLNTGNFFEINPLMLYVINNFSYLGALIVKMSIIIFLYIFIYLSNKGQEYYIKLIAIPTIAYFILNIWQINLLLI